MLLLLHHEELLLLLLLLLISLLAVVYGSLLLVLPLRLKRIEAELLVSISSFLIIMVKASILIVGIFLVENSVFPRSDLGRQSVERMV